MVSERELAKLQLEIDSRDNRLARMADDLRAARADAALRAEWLTERDARIAELEAALREYATPDNWRSLYGVHDPSVAIRWDGDGDERDGWMLAQATLAPKEAANA